MLVFDIETGPLPEQELQRVYEPPEQLPEPGKFDPALVKFGNMKDEAKRKAKLDAAREAHEKLIVEHKKTSAAHIAEHWSKFVDKAALSALTGRVLAIGYRSTERGALVLDIEDDESVMLNNFWMQFFRSRARGQLMVGHNISGFDVPFIARRSWMNGIEVPSDVLERGRFLNPNAFADTMQCWACGTRDYVKLDVLAKAFGLEGKTEGIDGSMFASLFKNDRPKAEEYLRQDLDLTAAVAERIGLL